MKEELEKLDASMGNICREIMLMDEDVSDYTPLLNTLAQQYKAYLMLISKCPGNEEPYYVKYANLDDIKNILTSKGYLEKEPQVKGR